MLDWNNATFEQLIEYYEKHISQDDHCKICHYGIKYDCEGGVRSGGGGEPIYPPCADGDIDYDEEALLEAVLEDIECKREDIASMINIRNVYFNEKKRVTVVKWEDGTTTKVACQNNDKFDKEKGIALCFMKKIHNNKGNYNEILKKYTKEK